MAKLPRKRQSILSLAKMARKGSKYETPQAKRTKADPRRKKAAKLERSRKYLDKLKREAMGPAKKGETAEERRKRLEREKRKKTMLGDNPATRSVKQKIGSALTEKEKQRLQGK